MARKLGIPRGSGIYIITTTGSNKVYIGSSVHLQRRRMQHFGSLRVNKHKNPHLQNAFNLYGEESFKFEILEFVKDKTLLLQREQFYLDQFKEYEKYNVSKKAESIVGITHSLETRKKFSASHKTKYIDLPHNISYEKRKNVYHVSIYQNGRSHNLGYYKTIEEAIAIRDKFFESPEQATEEVRTREQERKSKFSSQYLGVHFNNGERRWMSTVQKLSFVEHLKQKKRLMKLVVNL
jgi:group I intron endonuclease